jgi:hypothetical protein
VTQLRKNQWVQASLQAPRLPGTQKTTVELMRPAARDMMAAEPISHAELGEAAEAGEHLGNMGLTA